MTYISDPRLKVRHPGWPPFPEPGPVLDVRAQGGLPDLAMFGANFTGKCYEDWRWHNSNGYFAILSKYHHPAFINLTGAEQYPDARKRAAESRSRLPYTRILWRHMIHQPPGASSNTDKGMWRLPAQEYVDNIVLAHGTADLYNVTDCEGSIDRAEVQTYAAMQAAVLDYGVPAPHNARFAVLRMSTHHPLPEILDSGDLDELLKAIGRNMGNWDDPKVVISNNGYFDDTDNEDGLLTARRIEQRCIQKFGFRPVTCMGEYGFDNGFTSVNGWRVSGLNGAEMVDKLIEHARYIEGMAACVYGVGFSEEPVVANFHLDNAELELLMKLSPVYAPPGPIVIPPIEEALPVVIPAPVEIALKPAYDALLMESTNLRTEPTPDNRKSKVVGTVKVEPGKDTVVRVQEPVEPVTNDDDDVQFKVYTWFRVTATLPGFAAPVTAWMAKHREDLFKRIDPEPVPDEPPVEEPPPDDEPNEVPATRDDVNKLRDEMLAYHNLSVGLLTEKINTLQARVDGYERIMRAHHLSIETELKLLAG